MTLDSIKSYATFVLNGPLVYRNWWDMFLLRHSNAPRVTLELRNGLTFLVRPRSADRTTLNEMLMLRPYETDPRFRIGPSDTVVDIGAHIGSFTVLAASQARQGKVFAFEPVADNYAMLCDNVRHNALDNVFVAHAAVGVESGPCIVYGDGTGANTLGKGGAGQQVRQTTLAQLMAERDLKHIDLLKLDCEGAEHGILANAGSLLRNSVRRIALECHDLDETQNLETLQRVLRGSGFEVHAATPDAQGHSMLFALNQTLA